MTDQGQPLEERLRAFARLAAGLVLRDDPRIGATYLVRGLATLLQVDACVARRLEEGRLHYFASSGIDTTLIIPVLPASEGIGAHLIESKTPITIVNTEEHEATAALAQRATSQTNHYRFRSYAGSPILIENEVRGVVGVYSSAKIRNFTPSELALLQIASSFLGALMISSEATRSG